MRLSRTITAVAVAAAICFALAGCSGAPAPSDGQSVDISAEAAQEGPIYLPSSMTISRDGTTYIESYVYDERGNLLNSTDSRVKTSGGAFIDASGDVSRYAEGASYNSTAAYTLNESGTPTSLTRNTVNEGEHTTATLDFTIDVADSGLWERITTSRDGKTGMTAIIEYNDGVPKTIERDYGKGSSATEFDKSGWEASMVDSPESVFDESSGALKSASLYGQDYSFEYDENGCLSEVYRDGELEAQIVYVAIDDPSPAVRALSHLKLDSIGFAYPYDWCWELGGTFLG